MKSNAIKFGLMLPAFVPSAEHKQSPELLYEFAQRAENLGFDSLWMIDHFLFPEGSYRQSWLEPMTVLTALGIKTQRIKLGTSILVLPLRNPAILAKTMATMNFFLPDRLVLGVAPGWNPREYEACGIPINQRGRRTDEYISILRKLWSEGNASFQGEFFRFNNIDLEPKISTRLPLWIGGGSQYGKVTLSKVVLERIARSDGWITRATSTPELIKADWAKISRRAREIGRDPGEITLSHTNMLYLVDTADRSEAVETQKKRFANFSMHDFDYIQKTYWTGTVDDIVKKIEAIEQLGIKYIMLQVISTELEQLDLIAKGILSRFRGN